ncbi:partner of bursicon-like [Mytilus californianus]|uniref:partner of bursicon-like n=1 Tax=Mytilus californianus TaxID=6549 RepID=UPI002247BCAD|nr:partner of bursicon-like [Mytilus californianus]
MDSVEDLFGSSVPSDMSPIRTLLHIICVIQSLHVVFSENENICAHKETEMTITRSIEVSLGGNIGSVDCTGRVTVKQCEGTCLSKAKPSGNSETGMERTCQCCRETGLTSKTVILDECYDGTELIADFKPTTSVTEPSGCSCLQCRN